MNTLETDHGSPEIPVDGSHAGLATLRARLLRHARLLVSDRDLAEDLVQETLIAVLRGHEAHRGESTLTTWAVAILRHKAADWYRSPGRSATVGFDDFDAVIDELTCANEPGAWAGTVQHGGFAQPDHALERRELASAIDDCVERLPARSRQVFRMREQLGFETDEVCCRLDISHEHCRTLLHRARLALRSHLRAKSHAPSAAKNSRHAASLQHDLLTDCTA